MLGSGCTEPRAWHPLTPSWVPLPPPGQVKHTGGTWAVFCAWSLWLPVYVSFLGLLLVLFALGYVGHYFFVVLVSGRLFLCVLGCLRSPGYWIPGEMAQSTETHGNISSLFLRPRAARMAWLDSGYMLRRLLASGRLRTFSTFRWTRILRCCSLFSSVVRRSGEVCTVDASACSSWPAQFARDELMYMAMQKMDGFLPHCVLFRALHQLECRGREAVHRHCPPFAN